MHRILTLFLLTFGTAFTLVAQIKVKVIDQGDGAALPYAHITWEGLKTATKGVVVSNVDGRCNIPVVQADALGGVAIRIDFIGYVPVEDTLFSMEPRTYTVERAGMFDLDELVVTGQYKPTRADRAVQKLHVINAEKIQRLAAQNLSDVLGQELNMRLSQDNALGSSVSMRGLGGENVKVLVDGVPVIGRQDGNLDLSQIDLSGIDRIEILEGPLSVNYGTNALAGTINLITKKSGGHATSLRVRSYAEQIGRLNLSVAAGKRFGKSDVLLTLGRNFFGGWDADQPRFYQFAAQPADANRFMQWKPRTQYQGRLNYRFDLNDRWMLNYKGEVMQDLLTDRGRPRAPYYESAFDAEFRTQRVNNAFFTTANLPKGRRFHALLAYDTYQREQRKWVRDLTTLNTRPVPGEDDDSRFTLANARATWSQAPEHSKFSFEGGMDLNMETAAGDRVADGATQTIGDYAGFLSLQWEATPRITIRPGARYAYNTDYNAPLIPSIDTRFQLDTALTLRASFAQGFRAPSLKELYIYFVDVNHDIRGNPDLRAESSNNYSLSLSYRKARDNGVVRAELSLYHDRVQDLITLAEESGLVYTYINLGEYRTLGGSVGAGWEAGHWTVNGGVGATGRYDTLGLRATGTQGYDFAPEANLNLTRHWRKQGWSANLFSKYQGEQQSFISLEGDSLSRGRIAPYLMLDASVAKALFNDRLTVQVGCKNIADVTDLEATLGSGGAHSGAGGVSVPLATGRTFFMRLVLDLKAGPRKEQT